MGVQFRRIGGRVVPIKTDHLKVVKGAAEIAGGVGLAVAGGVGTAKLVRRASSMIAKGRTLFKVHRAFSKTAESSEAAQILRASARAGAHMAKNGKVLYRLRNPLLATTAIVSGALFSAGAERINSAVGGKPEKVGVFKYVTGAGVGAAISSAAYYKAIPIKGIGKLAKNVYAKVKGLPSPHKAEWWK